MKDSQVRWSDLPPDLWPLIGKHFHTYIDVLRFRSVCRSWRDSVPKLKALLPDSMNQTMCFNLLVKNKVVVFERITYRLSRLDLDPQQSAKEEGWLATIEYTKLGDKLFQRPIHLNSSRSQESSRRKKLNLLDFRMEEVAKSHFFAGLRIHTNIFRVSMLDRVVMLPDSNFIAMNNRNLVLIKHGKRPGSLIGETHSEYHDAIMHKGQFHTIDRHGRVFSIVSPSMKLVQISPPILTPTLTPDRSTGERKHLVECRDELYVVDRFLEGRSRFLIESRGCVETVGFKVYRLEGSRWVEVEELGNHQAFVLGRDCFSVSASNGFEENCIYFKHHLDLTDNFVFHLHNKTITKATVHIFKTISVGLD